VSAGDAAHTKITVLAEAKAPTWEMLLWWFPIARRRRPMDEFENDFGIHQKSPWWIGRMLQSAKYQVDTMISAPRKAYAGSNSLTTSAKHRPTDPAAKL